MFSSIEEERRCRCRSESDKKPIEIGVIFVGLIIGRFIERGELSRENQIREIICRSMVSKLYLPAIFFWQCF